MTPPHLAGELPECTALGRRHLRHAARQPALVAHRPHQRRLGECAVAWRLPLACGHPPAASLHNLSSLTPSLIMPAMLLRPPIHRAPCI